MSRTTRALAITTTTAVLLLLASPIAGADELEDYLSEAAEASYAGQQATWSSFLGKTEFAIVSVEQAGSMTMVETGDSSQVLGGGRTIADGSGNGLALSDWSSVAVATRYETVSAEPDERIGREVMVVTVNEDDATRVRIWFDEATGAPLISEVYDGDGELFRFSWMLDFDSNPRRIYTAITGDSTYDVVVASDADSLPGTVSAYQKVDTYAGPDDSVHVFYSDGLFSFSVFVLEGEGATGPFVEADTMKLGSGSYRWILTPSDMWVQWSGGGLTYVLVGDLPPDHLEEVLAELPAPAQGNLLSRIWGGIFG
jgi:negative regulator of sigma E activity